MFGLTKSMAAWHDDDSNMTEANYVPSVPYFQAWFAGDPDVDLVIFVLLCSYRPFLFSFLFITTVDGRNPAPSDR